MHSDAIARGVQAASRERGAAIAPDPRLATLASWVAQSLMHDVSAPPSAVIDLYARHLGLVEPTPHMLIMLQPNAAALERQIASDVTQLMPTQHYTHFGAFSEPRGDGLLAVLVLSFRQLTLAPVPRSVTPDAKLLLRGSLSPGLNNAQLVITYPDGSNERSQPQATDPFVFEVKTHGRGEHRLELIADSSDGIQVVANFPVYAGVPPTRELTLAADSGGAPLDADQLAARLFELMNQERTRARRKPVQQDPRLAAVALAHSQDMQRNNFVAHTSPTTGTAVDRVKRAGIRTPVVLENIGRGYSAEEIHRGLMESPGHRENILNPDATHVGMGAIVMHEDQQSAYLVTEVFARFATRVDLDAATSQLMADVAQARSRRGLSPLKTDTKLSQLCARAAQSFFQDSALSKEQLIERLNQEAAKTQPAYTQLMAASVLISSVEEATKLQPWFDPKAHALAIGLAQGTRADTFQNAIILVALIGY